jgi:type II secretory pathway pseudopilin PulG
MAKSKQRGVTRVELLIGLGLVGLLTAIGFALVRGGQGSSEQAEAMATARRIVTAASDWKRDHREVGCPTVSQLIVDRVWRRDEPSDDPWGGRFRIHCSSEEVRVRSPGRDGRFETEDDVQATAAWTS